MKNTVQLKINGKAVRLNPFVQKSLRGVIAGFIQSLDDIPLPLTKIEIKIAAGASRNIRKQGGMKYRKPHALEITLTEERP